MNQPLFKNCLRHPPIYPKCNNFKNNPTEDLQLLVSCRRFRYEPLEWTIHHYKYPLKISTQWHISSITFNLVDSILCCSNYIRINNRACTTVNTHGSCCAFVRCVWLPWTHRGANEKWNTVASTIKKGGGEVCWAKAFIWLTAEAFDKIYYI